MAFAVLAVLILSFNFFLSLAIQVITKDGLPSTSLSEACINALVDDIACPSLIENFGTGKYASLEALEEACTAACRDALGEYQGAVEAACDENDVYNASETSTLPVSLLPQLLLYHHGKACIQDEERWCHHYAYEMSGDNVTGIDLCDDCYIRQMHFMASSPFYGGYGLQPNYSSLTSSCSKTDFPITVTPPSTGRRTPTSTLTPSPSCSGTMYTLAAGDTCQSVSKSQQISTAWLLYDNALPAFCIDFPASGDLCVERSCTTYTLREADTCKSIAQAHVLTQTQLQTWNPVLSVNCRDIQLSVGDEICISPPGDDNWSRPTLPSTISWSTGTSTPTSTPAPVPTDIANGTVTRCAHYYLVQPGDYCNQLVLKYSLSLEDFLFLNPSVNANCTNLWAFSSYCVEPVGSIDSYPGHPGYIPPEQSQDMISFTDLPTATFTPPANVSLPTDRPLASGTRKDCYLYVDGGEFQFDIGGTSFNSVCDLIALSWSISLTLLHDCIDSADCSLEDGYRYCMRPSEDWSPTISSPTSTPSHFPVRDCYSYCVLGPIVSTTTPTTTPTNPSIPGPTQSGSPSSCNQWHLVADGDSCWTITQEYGITLDQFYEWNPAVKNDCAEGFWYGYAYCVGVGA
ncbi:hypothetical protein BJX65DRAFT_292598 [Aspergillus insuetus]